MTTIENVNIQCEAEKKPNTEECIRVLTSDECATASGGFLKLGSIGSAFK
jgi:hypothetical protein